MCEINCARRLFFLCNVIVWLGGAALLGIGLWMKIDPTIVRYLLVVNINQTDPLVDHAALLFIVVGAVAVIICFIGCCGAIRQHQGLLFIYAALVLVIMLAEVAGAIMALLYRQQVDGVLLSHMTDQVKTQYTGSPGNSTTATDAAWDFLQADLECCGASNFTDYRLSYWWNNTRPSDNIYVPDTCCTTEGDGYKDLMQCQYAAKDMEVDNEYLHTEGCHEAVHMWFNQHTLIMMLLGFCIGAAQMLAFTTAIILRRSMKNKMAV